jgi:hypothetical protein
LIFLLGSCSSWKKLIVAKGDQNDAVQNAIYDFLHSEKISKKDSVFYVHIKNINDEVLGIGILGSVNRLLPGPDNKIGTNYANFPTKYIVQDGKLFYWYDSAYVITEDLITVLVKYDHIDTLNMKGFVGIPETSALIDDSKKGIDYYFCKCNLLHYKKVRTKTAMGWYDIPKLNCRQK